LISSKASFLTAGAATSAVSVLSGALVFASADGFGGSAARFADGCSVFVSNEHETEKAAAKIKTKIFFFISLSFPKVAKH
jgi:hypothetical protein